MTFAATPQAKPVATASNPVRTRGRAVVQIAPAIPATDDGWQIVPFLTPKRSDDGWGNVIGSATFRARYGVIKRANWPRWLSWAGPLDARAAGLGRLLAGLWCRILITDTAGSVSLGTGALVETFAPTWWGTFGNQDDAFSSAPTRDVAGALTISASGMLGVLEDVWPTRGWALGYGAAIADPGGLLIFNGSSDHGTMVGNRSASPSFIRETGGTAYIFDMASGTKWTARQALDHLFACYCRRKGVPLKFTLVAEDGGDLDTMLGYSERWDLRGMNVLQMITRIINNRRGLGFRAVMNGTTVEVRVDTAFATAMTVGSLTIPANQSISDLDVRNRSWLHEPRLITDPSNVVDEVIMEGDPDVSVQTLRFLADYPRLTDDGHGEIVLAFTTTQETAWDGATDEQRKAPVLEGVWREFDLAADWNGSPETANDPNVGLCNRHRTTRIDNDPLHGEGGIDGLIRISSAPAFASISPAAGVLRFEKLLPMYTGADYSTLNDAQAQALPTTGSLIPPLIFYSPNGNAPWQDLSDQFQLTMLKNRAGFQLGAASGADQAALRALLIKSGAVLMITVAISGPLHLSESWVRPQNTLPRTDWPRQIRIPATGMQRWRILKGTAIGVDGDGDVVQLGQDLYARDDLTQLRQLLALSLPWQTLPRSEVTWTETGIIDISNTWRPGALMRSLIRGDKTDSINGPVIRRIHDYEAWTTQRTTQRPMLDVGAIT